jgi:hypothetical protein
MSDYEVVQIKSGRFLTGYINVKKGLIEVSIPDNQVLTFSVSEQVDMAFTTKTRKFTFNGNMIKCPCCDTLLRVFEESK